MIKERLLSVDDICEYIGIQRDTVYRWIDTKGLPAYRVGRFWRFRLKEVDSWLRKKAC